LGTEPTAANASAKAHPIGSGKTKTRESGTVDKGFDQKRPDTITGLPVISQARQNQAQHLRSEIGAADFLAYQKPGESDDFLQMPEASIGGPTDPLVAGAEAKCRRSKSQRTQPPVSTADEVAHLGADQGRIAARMLFYDQVIPQAVQWIVCAGNKVHVQALDLIHPARNMLHDRQWLTRWAKTVGRSWAPIGFRQLEQFPVLELVQGNLGTGQAQPTIGRTPVQTLADFTSQSGVRDMRLFSQHFVQVLDQLGRKRAPAHYQRFHGRECRKTLGCCLLKQKCV
jgi:hypothetical protein